MRICCFAFSCFGGKEEEDGIATSNLFNFYCRNKEGSHMRELGNVTEEMDNDDSELGFWANLRNGGGGGSGLGPLGLGVDGERGNANEGNEMLPHDGEMNQESENFLLRLNDVMTRRADGASGSEEMKVDVNLNLGLGGEPSSSTSMIATGRDSSGRDSQNKRPKVHSFSL